MISSIVALLAASSFGLGGIFLRRGVLKVSDASLGTLITIPMGVPFFFLIIAITGQLQSIIGFSWRSYVWLSLAGIIQFVVGRSFSYKCIQLVGANIAGILRRVEIFVTVLVSISFLHEPLSWHLAIGVVFIIIGITLAGFSSQLTINYSSRFSKFPLKAYLFGFANGVAWGLGPIFIKLGLKGSGSPIAGVFISFLAGTAFLGISLVHQKRRTSIAQITGKAAGMFLIGGLLGWTANLFRFIALSMAPASVVSPLVSTYPVFVLVFSYFFNRNLEIFSKPVIIGTVIVVIGSIVLV